MFCSYKVFCRGPDQIPLVKGKLAEGLGEAQPSHFWYQPVGFGLQGISVVDRALPGFRGPMG
jgi:hypothetical protein